MTTENDDDLKFFRVGKGELVTLFSHGGQRPNQTGRPKVPEDQKRQRVSTKLAPGSKELAQAIAEVLKLPGWGYAIDLALVKMIEGDRELKVKLAEEGIIVKGNDGRGLE